MLTNLSKYMAVLILAQVSLFYFGISQIKDPKKPRKEIISSDSTLTSTDEPAELKETILYKRISDFGSAYHEDASFNKIHKSDALNFNYLSIHQILANQSLSYPLFTGSFGKKDKIAVNGYFSSNSSFNGGLFNGLGFSQVNTWKLSNEQFENIEILEGSHAIGLSSNNGGTHFNYQEISYNVAEPFVRLWASDYDDNLLSFDGTWAQNIAPNLNVYAGYRSASARGDFDNSNARSRNLRIGFRKTIDSLSQINFTYLHSNHYLESNLGIDPNLSADQNDNFSDDPIDAIVNINSLNRREKDHFLTLNYIKKFDSSLVKNIHVNLSQSVSLIDENVGDLFQDTNKNIYNEYNENTSNLFVSSELELDNLFIKPTANINYISIGDSYFLEKQSNFNWDVGGLVKYRTSFLNLFSSIRLNNIFGNTFLNYGAGTEIKIDKTSILKIDFSNSSVAPNFYMPTNTFEKHQLLFAEFSTRILNSISKIKVWQRNITDQHLFDLNPDDFSYSISGRNLELLGVGLSTRFTPFKNIFFNTDYLDLNIQTIYNQTLSGNSPFPSLFIRANPNLRIPVGRSEVNFGFFYNYQSSFNGYSYNSFFDIYSIDNNRNLPEMMLNYEIYANFRLNHAWLKLSFENLLNEDIYNIAWHPAYDSMFKLSFNWTVR